jgi:hypothetical protein
MIINLPAKIVKKMNTYTIIGRKNEYLYNYLVRLLIFFEKN